ncbi:hypothetical protein BCR32DRAFT_277128 [Anaeromyces robustus]|uniref:Uncharacterized protein n=1 Tax=Anaeromyces robustus TaxID=1754192 RepID=A0A1Y1XF76_9FUNG|nr:hypothetical protein BCR32DRAFT_277128 [Anaeromyces robustus]|eukprot:ORX84431.1 hypothetical protein BCR32DRAFT_277128 [Anaeromyces robustus]
MANTILIIGDENGRLVKEMDENDNLIPVSVKVSINGEDHLLNIKDVISNLKNLETSAKYTEQFKNTYDENSDDTHQKNIQLMYMHYKFVYYYRH